MYYNYVYINNQIKPYFLRIIKLFKYDYNKELIYNLANTKKRYSLGYWVIKWVAFEYYDLFNTFEIKNTLNYKS